MALPIRHDPTTEPYNKRDSSHEYGDVNNRDGKGRDVLRGSGRRRAGGGLLSSLYTTHTESPWALPLLIVSAFFLGVITCKFCSTTSHPAGSFMDVGLENDADVSSSRLQRDASLSLQHTSSTSPLYSRLLSGVGASGSPAVMVSRAGLRDGQASRRVPAYKRRLGGGGDNKVPLRIPLSPPPKDDRFVFHANPIAWANQTRAAAEESRDVSSQRDHDNGHNSHASPALLTFVLVRADPGITNAMAARLEALAKELSETSYRLFVQFDGTRMVAGFPNRSKHLATFGALSSRLKPYNVPIHVATYSDVTRRYPGLFAMRMPGKGDFPLPNTPEHKVMLAHMFHTEPIQRFLANVDASEREQMGWLWVMEQDVMYTGKFSSFFDKYASNPADLVGSSKHKKYHCEPTWHKWMWAGTGSETFKTRYPKSKRWDDTEFVSRFSARLLEQLSKESDAGSHAPSEMHVCTVVKNTPGFTSATILMEDRGRDFSWQPHRRRDEFADEGKRGYKDEADWINVNGGPDDKNKIFHPVKF
eukprot:m.93209 g.93209  ORF g.93209 m.93209 type:complete len:531 (-) comp9988_c0_seq1:212-1804(-)